jgi:hypothetical protein
MVYHHPESIPVLATKLYIPPLRLEQVMQFKIAERLYIEQHHLGKLYIAAFSFISPLTLGCAEPMQK